MTTPYTAYLILHRTDAEQVALRFPDQPTLSRWQQDPINGRVTAFWTMLLHEQYWALKLPDLALHPDDMEAVKMAQTPYTMFGVDPERSFDPDDWVADWKARLKTIGLDADLIDEDEDDDEEEDEEEEV